MVAAVVASLAGRLGDASVFEFEFEVHDYIAAPSATMVLPGYLIYGDYDRCSPVGGNRIRGETDLVDRLSIGSCS